MSVSDPDKILRNFAFVQTSHFNVKLLTWGSYPSRIYPRTDFSGYQCPRWRFHNLETSFMILNLYVQVSETILSALTSCLFIRANCSTLIYINSNQIITILTVFGCTLVRIGRILTVLIAYQRFCSVVEIITGNFHNGLNLFLILFRSFNWSWIIDVRNI